MSVSTGCFQTKSTYLTLILTQESGQAMFGKAIVESLPSYPVRREKGIVYFKLLGKTKVKQCEWNYL